MARGKQRGTLFAIGPNRWRVQISLGRNPVTGKWVRRGFIVTGTKREAQKALTAALTSQDERPVMPRTQQTLGEWLTEFAETWSSHLKARSQQQAKESIRLYLPASLAGKRLAQLEPGDFQNLYRGLATRTPRPLSATTIGILHRALHTRITKAVTLGYLGRHPMDGVSPPKAPHREYRVLSGPEAALFLEEAEADPYAALWAVLLLGGLRPEEALGLQWGDLEGDTLRIRRALVRLRGGRWELTSTKTGRERAVPLPKTALRALQRHRARQAEIRLLLGSEYVDRGLIFAAVDTAPGSPLWWDNLTSRHYWPIVERLAFRLLGRPPAMVVRKGLKRSELAGAFTEAAKAGEAALKQTGLDRLRPYDLRHSMATLLLAAGEHPKVVAERLGHASTQLTLDTYSHVSPAMQERAAERLEAAMQPNLLRAGRGG